MSLISQLCMVGASCMALTIYLIIYLSRYGVPESVSATYYSDLPKWAFSTTLALAGGKNGILCVYCNCFRVLCRIQPDFQGKICREGTLRLCNHSFYRIGGLVTG